MRVALYARVSTATEEQEQALIQQLDRLRAAGAGHETREFIDVASGSKDDRPQLARLMEACHKGEVDRVICTRLDRLSRSMAHGAELLTYFSAPDTPSLLALDDALDLETIGGRLVARMLINLAQAETERLSERVSHGRAFERRRLVPMGPVAPYGYRFNADRSNYELDPETAPSARLLVEHYIEHGQMLELVRLAQGLPGKPPSSTPGMRAWLMNPSLAGYRIYGHEQTYRDKEGKLRKRRMLPGNYKEVHPGAHPPLISELQHAQVMAIAMEHTDRKHSRVVRGYVRELTKLVVCSHCNHVMAYQHHVRLGPVYLRCVYFPCASHVRNRIKVQTVKDAIWAKLKDHREELLAFVVASEGVNGEQLVQEQRLSRQIHELEAKQDPDLAEAIQKKKERLEDLMQMQGHRLDLEFPVEESRKALNDEAFWSIAQSDEQLTRRMFTDHVERVLVRDRKVEAVILRLGDGCTALS